jgi:hypothetical protein
VRIDAAVMSAAGEQRRDGLRDFGIDAGGGHFEGEIVAAANLRFITAKKGLSIVHSAPPRPPSIDRVLNWAAVVPLIAEFGREPVLAGARLGPLGA